jgi:hypothetical protein
LGSEIADEPVVVYAPRNFPRSYNELFLGRFLLTRILGAVLGGCPAATGEESAVRTIVGRVRGAALLR